VASVVKAEDTTVIKRDRDEDTTVIKRDRDGDKTVIEKREELNVLPVPQQLSFHPAQAQRQNLPPGSDSFAELTGD